MDKHRIEKLISAYLSGKYSKEGERLFNLWFESEQHDELNIKDISEEDFQRIKTEIFQSVSANIKDKEGLLNAADNRASAGRQKYFSSFMKIAAAVSVLVVAFILFYHLSLSAKIAYTTSYGETREIQLPDQSLVFLNANSRLAFKENWQQENSREVWLEGEAFFEVVKKKIRTKGYKKFTVHTDNVSVEVLGTKFNVNSRRTHTQVVLASGKVKLWTDTHETISMEPGDLVEVSGQEDKIIKKKVADVRIYSAWRDGKIVFDEMTLQDIAVWLEDHYGLQVTIKGNFSAKTTFSAAFQKAGLATLLKVFEESFHVNILKQGNTLVITEKRKKLPDP